MLGDLWSDGHATYELGKNGLRADEPGNSGNCEHEDSNASDDCANLSRARRRDNVHKGNADYQAGQAKRRREIKNIHRILGRLR
jgi:hypothetical protein